MLLFCTLQVPTSSLLLEIRAESLLCSVMSALNSAATAMAVFCQVGEEKSLIASSFFWVYTVSAVNLPSTESFNQNENTNICKPSCLQGEFGQILQPIFGILEKMSKVHQSFARHSYLIIYLWDFYRLVSFPLVVILCNLCNHCFLPNGRTKVFDYMSVWWRNITVDTRWIILEILQLNIKKAIRKLVKWKKLVFLNSSFFVTKFNILLWDRCLAKQ